MSCPDKALGVRLQGFSRKPYSLGDVLQQEIQRFLLLQIEARKIYRKIDEKSTRRGWVEVGGGRGERETDKVVNQHWILPSSIFSFPRAVCYTCRTSIRANNLGIGSGIIIILQKAPVRCWHGSNRWEKKAETQLKMLRYQGVFFSWA